MAPSNARALLYVWAMEQPNAQFKSCDVLVPVNLHEFGVDGEVPLFTLAVVQSYSAAFRPATSQLSPRLYERTANNQELNSPWRHRRLW
jgi:hypothetical protein